MKKRMNIPTRIASRFSTGITACQYRIGATILLSVLSLAAVPAGAASPAPYAGTVSVTPHVHRYP